MQRAQPISIEKYISKHTLLIMITRSALVIEKNVLRLSKSVINKFAPCVINS